jgi:hypothetical protein
MTDLNRPDSSNLDAYVLTTGTQVSANRVMTGGDPKVLGCTLLANTTYVFPLGTQKAAVPAESPYVCTQIWWNSAITITSITFETCLFPASPLGNDMRGVGTQVSDWDSTVGFWLQQNPTTAYVPATNATPTAMTVAPTALTQGGCEFDLGNFCNRRGRVKVVVGATSGIVRVGTWGKSGS